jgi:hypothetical protein
MKVGRYNINECSVAISTNSWEEQRLLTQEPLIVRQETPINPLCSPPLQCHVDETSQQSRHSDWLQNFILLQFELYQQIAY